MCYFHFSIMYFLLSRLFTFWIISYSYFNLQILVSVRKSVVTAKSPKSTDTRTDLLYGKIWFLNNIYVVPYFFEMSSIIVRHDYYFFFQYVVIEILEVRTFVNFLSRTSRLFPSLSSIRVRESVLQLILFFISYFNQTQLMMNAIVDKKKECE